jgi:hypothetical protein
VSTGNYIYIHSEKGDFEVGEIYFEDGRSWHRGTKYTKDGTEEQFDKRYC